MKKLVLYPTFDGALLENHLTLHSPYFVAQLVEKQQTITLDYGKIPDNYFVFLDQEDSRFVFSLSLIPETYPILDLISCQFSHQYEEIVDIFATFAKCGYLLSRKALKKEIRPLQEDENGNIFFSSMHLEYMTKKINEKLSRDQNNLICKVLDYVGEEQFYAFTYSLISYWGYTIHESMIKDYHNLCEITLRGGIKMGLKNPSLN